MKMPEMMQSPCSCFLIVATAPNVSWPMCHSKVNLASSYNCHPQIYVYIFIFFRILCGKNWVTVHLYHAFAHGSLCGPSRYYSLALDTCISLANYSLFFSFLAIVTGLTGINELHIFAPMGFYQLMGNLIDHVCKVPCHIHEILPLDSPFPMHFPYHAIPQSQRHSGESFKITGMTSVHLSVIRPTKVMAGRTPVYRLLERDGLAVEAVPIEHSTFCLGYVVSETQAVDLEPGVPLLDSTTVQPFKPRQIVILGDTMNPAGILDVVKRPPDMLVHEATFLDVDSGQANATKHSTASMAGNFAVNLKPRRLYLNHLGNRYFNMEGLMNLTSTLNLLKSQVEAPIKRAGLQAEISVVVANDYMRVKVLPSWKPLPVESFEVTEERPDCGGITDPKGLEINRILSSAENIFIANQEILEKYPS